jgi:hypothetical protein
MGSLLESEKIRLAGCRGTSLCLSASACAAGVYRGRPRPFCLPVECAEQNLFPGVRQTAPAYFASHGIKWHDGHDGKPSNHLCDSQVCCVNFLFPFADKPHALAEVLRPIFPSLREMLVVEDGQYVAFEWIGQENYLGERMRQGGTRTRGANYTSADAAVMFERTDAKRQIVLIEWKYTESYGSTSLEVSASGTDRTEIYKPLFLRNDCPLRKDILPSFGSLFFEPFYQFMRQQFLAHEMERAQELRADTVSVMHIAPNHNGDFARVTSPELLRLGETAVKVWRKLAGTNGRFISVSTEQLFGSLCAERLPDMRDWLDYIGRRYPWVSG